MALRFAFLSSLASRFSMFFARFSSPTRRYMFAICLCMLISDFFLNQSPEPVSMTRLNASSMVLVDVLPLSGWFFMMLK